ncbi:DHA2 family efflux MFS transporter permease subunit [Marinivivus vitaminiproducens]|uniref:DHA2 family efflux MFS transporter permease subunit n=1 Tax=Marinivivus vitaminiproducens TaxID=3035935 RepID=UPI0027A8B886|nr:DHA2 family efflux MFS transporter permease subunit [Geminicoccaceae bacterium SCSIO 64248]
MAEPTMQRSLVTIGVMLATIMQALDTTIANVALPYMQGGLAASQDQINWVLTSYIVAAAIMTPPTGWLARRFGRKRLFLVAVTGFTVASVLCGAAATLGQMVLFRLLQGLFGASLVPLSQAVMLDSYPKEQQGSAMAIWGVGVMVGPILGPTLGGWLTEAYDWRWVFYINLPVGILTFVLLTTFLSETASDRRARLDWLGFGLLSLAIGALQLMLDRGEQLDWFNSLEIVLEGSVSALAFYLFLAHMFTAEKPFISPGLFKDRNFSLGLLLIFFVGVVLLATLALLTPYLQNLMDYPVFTAGLVLAPRGVGTMIAMFIAGRLVARIDVRFLLGTGLILTVLALWEMTYYTPDVDQWTIVRNGLIQGMGLGFLFVPLSAVTFATLDPAYRTEGTGLFSLMRNIGSAIGISVVINLLSTGTQANHAELVRYATPFNDALHMPAPAAAWDLATLAGRAALNEEITRQASIIAYANDFHLLMLMAVAVMPLVLLLRPARSTGGAAGHAAMD